MLREKLIVLATRHSTLPNITPEMRENVQGIMLSVGDFYQKRKVISALPTGWTFKKFCGYEEKVKTYLSPHHFEIKNVIKSVSDPSKANVHSDQGIVKFDHFLYDEMISSINPDFVVALTEGSNPLGDPILTKRSIAKTVHYLRQSAFVQDSNRKSKVLAPIYLSKDTSTNHNHLSAILEFDGVDGLVLCGLQEGWEELQRELPLKEIGKLVGQIGKEYIISLSGNGMFTNTRRFEALLNHKIDILEVRLPFLLSQSHKALIQTPYSPSRYCIKTPQLKSSLSPLDLNCSCYSCTRHNEAYISHLISCKQPNAKILLSIHNLHAYMKIIDISD